VIRWRRRFGFERAKNRRSGGFLAQSGLFVSSTFGFVFVKKARGFQQRRLEIRAVKA
jgi:hypothetical protein